MKHRVLVTFSCAKQKRAVLKREHCSHTCALVDVIWA